MFSASTTRTTTECTYMFSVYVLSGNALAIRSSARAYHSDIYCTVTRTCSFSASTPDHPVLPHTTLATIGDETRSPTALWTVLSAHIGKIIGARDVISSHTSNNISSHTSKNSSSHKSNDTDFVSDVLLREPLSQFAHVTRRTTQLWIKLFPEIRQLLPAPPRHQTISTSDRRLHSYKQEAPLHRIHAQCTEHVHHQACVHTVHATAVLDVLAVLHDTVQVFPAMQTYTPSPRISSRVVFCWGYAYMRKHQP